MANKYRKLTPVETVKVYEALKLALIQHGDGTASYVEGQSDKRVGDAAIPDYPGDRAGAVGSYRRVVFGSFPRAEKKKPEPRPDLADMARRYAAMERQIRVLCDKLGEPCVLDDAA
jgi:hypothetical protein